MRTRILSLICVIAMLATMLVLPVAAAETDWIDPADKAPVTDYAYSFVAVGDTQNVCKKEPEKMANIYDWIVANVETKKIKYVFGMGDITNDSSIKEWKVAKQEHDKLNGLVPYSVIRGNHDTSFDLNKFFVSEEYKSQFEGFYEEGKVDNSWRTLTIGDVDYLMVTLDYAASDAMLDWAGEIIAAHPHHRVIISTHCYLYKDGNTVTTTSQYAPDATGNLVGKTNNGDHMWDYLFSKHENIFMILSGHIACDDVLMTEAKGVNGNTVYQFLIDPQDLDNSIGATGMIAILYFSEDGKTISVEQYSTVREKYYMSTSQFSFETSGESLHSFTNFVSDGNTTCQTLGTETAKCDGCDKTLTREVSAMAEHSYTDGTCTVCGAADPNAVTEPDDIPAVEKPVEDSDDGKDSNPLVFVIPGAVFLGAVIVGYLLGKKYKRK
ncbi:MAG: metallophosphoesterase [Clostridia bacterium]|nr:metallophosphoesterase [Clostridia bacterium]